MELELLGSSLHISIGSHIYASHLIVVVLSYSSAATFFRVSYFLRFLTSTLACQISMDACRCER
jgi:hypothetical protein